MEVWTAIDRLLRISTFFGLSQIHSANRPEVRTWQTVYSLIVACGLITLYPLQIQALQSLDEIRNQNLSQKICRGLYSSGHLICALLAVANSIKMQKILRDFLTDLRESMNSGLEIRIRGYLIANVIYLLGLLVFHLDELAQEFNWNKWRMVDIIVESLGIVYHILISMQFATFALAISAKLREMRRSLEAYLKALSKNSSAGDFKIKQGNFIQRCRISYMDLTQQAKILNELFATTNVWIIFNMSFVTTYMFYNRLVKTRRMLLEGDIARTMLLLEMAFSAFFGILISSTILLPCDEIRNRASELKQTVQINLVRATSRELDYELTKFADLLQSENFKFSPYGLFTLRKKLILTMAGLSVTYVTIISQLPEKIHKQAEQ